MRRSAPRPDKPQILPLLSLILTVALASGGCIRSRVHITSEPDGAEVIWRGEPYGATPVTIPFIWYWHYDFVLEKPGYQSLEVIEHFRSPPWFIFPMDLFAEIAPVPIPDNRERHYLLTRDRDPKPNPRRPKSSNCLPV